ncbi:MAG: DUF1598 domain-containing protein [Pirellulaceae bacterium]
MNCRFRLRWLTQVGMARCTALLIPSLLLAQGGGGDGGGGGGGGGDGGGGDDNDVPPVAGVEVDAEGVLRVSRIDPQLIYAQRAAARQSRPKALQAASPMRKVSLNRLESAVAARLEAGKLPTRDMMTLAGLTRIEYVFYLPETQDIVLAGPAEEVDIDATGRLVGFGSGSPTLRLDDLIVALRTFGPEAKRGVVVGCSIDPTQEGLQRMQAFLNQLGGQIGGNSDVAIASALRNHLGYQKVTVHGVPASTHFAQVLVEADYRMKLIGIGLDKPLPQFTSWVERANPSSRKANQMQRWYFVPNYDAVKVSPDRNALQLDGIGVKLVGEDEFVSQTGVRASAGSTQDRASQGFTKEFSTKYEAIAKANPIYMEMRNLFDLTIAAAFIQSSELYGKANWSLGAFAAENKLPVQGKMAPTQVESAVNAVWRGSTLMTPIGGGVTIATKSLLKDQAAVDEAVGQQATKSAPASDLAEGRWWWD